MKYKPGFFDGWLLALLVSVCITFLTIILLYQSEDLDRGNLITVGVVVFWVAFLSVFAFQALQAFHLAGSELTYQYLGDNNYKFILRVYRDCTNAQSAPFDDPLSIAIYTDDTVLMQYFSAF